MDYIATPLTAPELSELVAHIGVPVRELLRSKEAVFKELGLDNPAVTDDQLIMAVAQHPVLLNRPIVVTPKGRHCAVHRRKCWSCCDAIGPIGAAASLGCDSGLYCFAEQGVNIRMCCQCLCAGIGSFHPLLMKCWRKKPCRSSEGWKL